VRPLNTIRQTIDLAKELNASSTQFGHRRSLTPAPPYYGECQANGLADQRRIGPITPLKIR